MQRLVLSLFFILFLAAQLSTQALPSDSKKLSTSKVQLLKQWDKISADFMAELQALKADTVKLTQSLEKLSLTNQMLQTTNTEIQSKITELQIQNDKQKQQISSLTAQRNIFLGLFIACVIGLAARLAIMIMFKK